MEGEEEEQNTKCCTFSWPKLIDVLVLLIFRSAMSLRRAMSSSTVRKLNACAVFSISECIAVSHRFDAAGARAACAFFRPPGFIGVVLLDDGGWATRRSTKFCPVASANIVSVTK